MGRAQPLKNDAFIPLENLFLTGPAPTVRKRGSLTGFTLLELIVVVIILSILAGLVIPSYKKVLDQAHERDGYINLLAMQSAEEIYKSQNAVYWNTAWKDITDINPTLHLNLIENQMTYRCSGTDTDYSCEGTSTSTPSWTIQVTNKLKPYCSGGTCPKCDGAGCPY